MVEQMEIRRIPYEEARAQLAEIYVNPDAVAEFLDELIAVRTDALERFTNELNTDKGLEEQFRRDPIGLLNMRELIGPLDEISVEGITNPFAPYPYPNPPCHVECDVDVYTKMHLVIAKIVKGTPIYYPVFETHFHLTCHNICG